ncbi:alpha/beta hydrolase [Photobacterium sp. SDRW27]|uniref:gamma-mobile-trio protein GmtX n=1 Tax=Photobacterium obscurum TaxID=2829490 RepID=UPI00224423FB|nr:gamma-mobile-trio protein GmtX [Photobacterium obscurum]MCW8331942.1 alpha/beta hydrolase [Photobacterium obscurum]
MSEIVKPEIVLGELLANATARTAKAIKILNKVLEDQAESEKKDFCIATIGRLSAEAGGPSTQTIRNRTGKHFQQLIEVWATYSGTTTKKPMSVRQKQLFNSNDQAVLDSINDPVIRAVVGSILAERNRYRDQLNIIKANTEIVIDKTKNPETEAAEQLTPMEVEALKHAVSEELMRAMQWVVMPTGQIKDKEGNEVYKRGYVNGLKKL